MALALFVSRRLQPVVAALLLLAAAQLARGVGDRPSLAPEPLGATGTCAQSACERS